MAVAFYLLFVVGHLGVFDVVWFHTRVCRLHERDECQREVLWHTARHFVYALQFLCVANVRFRGAAILLFVAIFAADVVVAWADVWEETESRNLQGGLPRGEYFMHVVLSVLVGAYLCAIALALWPDRGLPASIALEGPAGVPLVLRAWMTAMGLSAIVVFVHDLRRWILRRARVAA